MKIAMLYAFHARDQGWSCPISLVNEFERMGHQVDSFNLYELDDEGIYKSYTDSGLKDFLDCQLNYDLLIHMDYGMFFSPLFANFKIPSILEAGDDPQRFSQNFQKSQYFDFIFTPDKNCCKFYQLKGMNAIWLTHWADPTIHMDYKDILPDKIAVTTCDSGRGNGLIDFLRTKLSPDVWLDDRFYYGADHSKFMNRGYIVFQKSQFGEVTRRPFEAAACKRMVLMDEIYPSTGIYDIFKPDRDAVYYRNWNEAVDKILYYKDHIEEAKEIAQNGYEVVMNNHTVSHRAKALLDFIGE